MIWLTSWIVADSERGVDSAPHPPASELQVRREELGAGLVQQAVALGQVLPERTIAVRVAPQQQFEHGLGVVRDLPEHHLGDREEEGVLAPTGAEYLGPSTWPTAAAGRSPLRRQHVVDQVVEVGLLRRPDVEERSRGASRLPGDVRCPEHTERMGRVGGEEVGTGREQLIAGLTDVSPGPARR